MGQPGWSTVLPLVKYASQGVWESCQMEPRHGQGEAHCWLRPWRSEGDSAKPLRAALWAETQRGGMTSPCKSLGCEKGQPWDKALRMPYQRGQRDTLTELLLIHSSINNLLRSNWSLSPNWSEFPYIIVIVHASFPIPLINSCLSFETQFKCDFLDQIIYTDLFIHQALLAYKAYILVMNALGKEWDLYSAPLLPISFPQ